MKTADERTKIVLARVEKIESSSRRRRKRASAILGVLTSACIIVAVSLAVASKLADPGTKPDQRTSATETETRPKETIYVSYETETSSKKTDSLSLDVRDYIPDRVESPGLLGPVSQVPESGETMEKEGRP